MILAFSHVITALDVTPAAMRQKTTMVLRFINEQGRELDRVVFSRTAGVLFMIAKGLLLQRVGGFKGSSQRCR
jgi:hypothetical protein